MADIAWFKELSKKDVPLVGGKGANLGEMYNAGLPIPPGFAVTSEAFQKFIQGTKIDKQIFQILDNTNVDENDELDAASAKIKSIIMNTPMHQDLKEEIKEAYENLNVDEEVVKAGGQALDIIKSGREQVFVAVRSSATAEDLPSASFAGQQETFLNIRGVNKLLEAVQKCWASLYTPRAIYYRVKNNFPHEKVLISVIVQKMVMSEKSGVMFSINPATNNENEIMIEAGWGLGEAVVSGAISPDQYIVDKQTLELKEKMIREQTWMYDLDTNLGYTVKRDIPEYKKKKQKLNETEIKRLSELAIKIEEHYGAPQDIEYAIEGNQIFIVQSRPVTTLKKPHKDE
ncbi:MAG: PEP/pyruvate-binding domain-containing protein, partial [Candidatus Nanoarchaeia archaeon]